MNKLISKIVGACLGLSLATGVGVGVAVGQSDVKEANASSGTYTKITATSSLTTGDKIILATEVNNVPTEGVTGGNTAGNNRDALHSGTESEWVEYTVTTAESGWTLYDSSASKYIGIGNNYFQYVDTGATLYTDSNGYLLTAASSGRVLVINTSGQNETSRFVAQSNIGKTGYTPYVIWKVTSGSAPVAVSSISLSSNSETIKVGKDVTLTPTISPDNATNKTVVWTTSNSSVATVANGVVTGVAVGNATITAIADENNNGTLDTGEKSATCSVTVQAIQTIDATVAEALTACSNLGNNQVTDDYYRVTGYVTEITEVYNSNNGYISFVLSDDKAGSNSLTVYRVDCDAATAADIVLGTKLSVVGPIKRFGGTTLEIINCSSTVITIIETPTDVYPEPTMVANSTLAALWADTNGKNKLKYQVTGTFDSWYSSDDYGKVRGRLYVTDSNDTKYLIYGCTANASALTWDERSNVYTYAEQTDFLTNNVTKDIGEGYVLTMELTRCDYNDTIEAHGIITNVQAPAKPELTIDSTYCIYKDTNYLVEMGDSYGISGVEANALVLTAKQGSTSGTYALETNGSYLSWESGNTLILADNVTANSSWVLSGVGTDLSNAVIVNSADSTRILQFNNSANPKRFACYAGTQANASIKPITPADPSAVASVELDKTTASVQVQSTIELVATIKPSTATTNVATWLTSDASVATVSSGVVTGVSAGSATITAFADENSNGTLDTGEKSATCALTVTAIPTPSGDGEWVLESIANLTSSDIFVIVGNDGDDYAMSNNNGTGSAPSAVQVTIANGKITSPVADNIKWNISGSASGYTFYPNGDSENWLYCTNTNNGVRVGTNNNKTFTIKDGYLNHVGTSRYVGIYNSQDWRCYTSINANIENQAFAFYKYVENSSKASDYADLFLETLSTGDAAVCQVTQSGEVQTVLSELVDAWERLADEFDKLGDDKSLFTEGQADEDGTNIQKAIALYDYIATKYNTQLETATLTDYNFMGRTITPASNVMRLANVSDSAAIPAIVVVIALATVTTGAYFFLRKKKEN